MTASSLRRQVMAEEPDCRRCGWPSVEVDHIVPRCRGGTDDRANLQGLCLACHDAKSRRDMAPWLSDGDHKAFTWRNRIRNALWRRAGQRCETTGPDGRVCGKRAVAVYGPAVSSSDGPTLDAARRGGTLEQLEACFRRGATLVVTCAEHRLPLVEPVWARRSGRTAQVGHTDRR